MVDMTCGNRILDRIGLIELIMVQAPSQEQQG